MAPSPDLSDPAVQWVSGAGTRQWCKSLLQAYYTANETGSKGPLPTIAELQSVLIKNRAGCTPRLELLPKKHNNMTCWRLETPDVEVGGGNTEGYVYRIVGYDRFMRLFGYNTQEMRMLILARSIDRRRDHYHLTGRNLTKEQAGRAVGSDMSQMVGFAGHSSVGAIVGSLHAAFDAGVIMYIVRRLRDRIGGSEESTSRGMRPGMPQRRSWRSYIRRLPLPPPLVVAGIVAIVAMRSAVDHMHREFDQMLHATYFTMNGILVQETRHRQPGERSEDQQLAPKPISQQLAEIQNILGKG